MEVKNNDYKAHKTRTALFPTVISSDFYKAVPKLWKVFGRSLEEPPLQGGQCSNYLLRRWLWWVPWGCNKVGALGSCYSAVLLFA